MAQQQLHHTQIRAVIDQMRGKRMTQTVRRQRGQPDLLRVFRHHLPGQLPRNPHFFLRHENIRARLPFQQLRPRGVQIAFQPVRRHLTQRHDALLVALADGIDHAARQIQFVQRQLYCLAHAQSGGIHQFQQGFVAQSMRRVRVGGGEQRVDLRFAHGLRQAARYFGGLQIAAGIVVPLLRIIQILIPFFHGGQGARLGARLFVGGINRIGKLAAVGVLPVGLRVGQAFGHLVQIMAVGFQRVVREPLLQPQVFKESVDVGHDGWETVR